MHCILLDFDESEDEASINYIAKDSGQQVRLC